MFVCECGREFSTKNGINCHKHYCKGIEDIKRCQNPLCNKILTTITQVKYCSSGCATIVTAPGRKHSIETRNKISISNGGKGEVGERNKKCLNCDKPTNGKKYCNANCQIEKQNRDSIKDWIENNYQYNSVRSFMKYWLIEQKGEKCHICGWSVINPYTKRIPLEIHHIDGNWKNNSHENITLVCPNCHSLTSTYRNNTGNGREYQLEYYHKYKKRK